MGFLQDVIRRITVQGKTEGVDAASAQLRELATAHGSVAVASERTEKSTLGLENRLRSIERAVDAEARSEMTLAKIQKDLDAARRQGLITAQRQTELSTLAAQKYVVESEGAKKAAEGMKLLKEASLGLVAGLGAGALFVGIAELPRAIAETVEKLGKIGNTAETIGITAKQLQELRYAARLSDVEVGTLDEAMQKFSTNLGKPGSPLQKIFELNNKRISGNVFTDLRTYADLIKNATNQEQRNALVSAGFGKSAQEMGRLFNEGGDGIAHWAEEAQRANAVHSDEEIARAKAYNDQMQALAPRLESAQQDFAVMITPVEIGLMQTFTGLLRDTTDLLSDISNFDGQALRAKLHQMFADDGSHPSLMGERSGIFAIDWFGNGSVVTGNRNLLSSRQTTAFPARPGTVAPNSFNASSATPTKLPVVPDQEAIQRAAAIQRVTDALNLQIKALGESNRQQFIDQQLAAAKVTSASKEGKAIEDLAGRYYDEKAAIDATNQAASFLAQATFDAFNSVTDGSTSAIDAALNLAKALAQAVLQAELLGSGPLADILGTKSTDGSAGGGLGSIFTSLLKGIIGGAAGGAFGTIGLGGVGIPSGGFIPGLTGPMLNAKGGVYAGAGISAYSGSIVSRPTLFPFALGVGLMGEAGPEAILPLRRAANGQLGVAANQSGGGVTINFHNVSKQDIPDLDEWARTRLPAYIARATSKTHRATL